MLLPILLYSFIAITVIHCLYYLVFSKFSFSKHPTIENDNYTPVSVIVYSKNEAETLLDFLAQFDKQTHTNFELVLVNNASSDNTRYIFEDFQKTHSNVQVVNVENNEAFWGSRKYALTLGIKKATHDILLFTTTTVVFDSEDWITTNSSLLKKDTQIIVGYNYSEKKSDFTTILIRFAEIIAVMQNFGTGFITKPYAASKSNFGYKKSLFFEKNGFSEHMLLHEGAEDLYLKQNGTSKNVVIATGKENSTQIKSPDSLSQWIQSKISQKSISKHYSFGNKFNLKVFTLSQILFFLLLIANLITAPSIIVYIIIAIRYFVVGSVIAKTAFKLRDIKLFYFFPLMEIIYMFIQIPIFMGSLSSKK